MPLALIQQGRAAPDSGANTGTDRATLPLRNLQIEVRQVLLSDPQRGAPTLQGRVLMQPGASRADLIWTQPSGPASPSQQADQRLLVLNGRRARIALHNSTPFRLVQTWVRNGVWTIVPGTVLLEAGTGFEATPEWDGGDQVTLSLSAAQGQGAYQTPSASTATLVVLPLGEWVSVAQSVQHTQDATAGLARGGSASVQTEVQVRVTLP